MKKPTNKKEKELTELERLLGTIKVQYGFKNIKDIAVELGKNEVYLSAIKTKGIPKALMNELKAKFPLAFKEVEERYSLDKYIAKVLTERVAGIIADLSGGTLTKAVEAQKIIDEARSLAEYDLKRAFSS